MKNKMTDGDDVGQELSWGGYPQNISKIPPEATDEELTDALMNKDFIVRSGAVKHHNLTSKHIDIAIEDKHYWIRHMALMHPNAKKRHFLKGMADEAPAVRDRAKYMLNKIKQNLVESFSD